MKRVLLKRFEELGADQVRTSLNIENMSPIKRQVALEFLAEKGKISDRLAEADKAAHASAASRAAEATERAAVASELQAQTAKQALAIAIVSAIMSAVALIVSIFGSFQKVR